MQEGNTSALGLNLSKKMKKVQRFSTVKLNTITRKNHFLPYQRRWRGDYCTCTTHLSDEQKTFLDNDLTTDELLKSLKDTKTNNRRVAMV